MNVPTETELTGADAGLEEEGVGDEVRMGPTPSHRIEDGNRISEMTRIKVGGDQTDVDRLGTGEQSK